MKLFTASWQGHRRTATRYDIYKDPQSNAVQGFSF